MLKKISVLAASAGWAMVPGAAVWAQMNAGAPYRVADFPLRSAVTPPRVYTNMGLFQSLGDRATFIAAGPAESGRELWVTDGTNGGTHLLKELDPRTGLDVAPDGSLGYISGGVRRAAYIGSDETGLLVADTDGTAEGTRVVRIPRPRSTWAPIMGPVAGKPLLYVFSADPQLWVVDGAEARPIGGPTQPGFLGGPVAVAQTPTHTFLRAQNPDGTWRLWRTDGTAAGTVEIGGYGAFLNGDAFVTVGERLFLTRITPQGGSPLLTVDPGADSTREIPMPPGFTLSLSSGLAPLPDGSGVLVGAREGTLLCNAADQSLSVFRADLVVAQPPTNDGPNLPRVIRSPLGDRTLFIVRLASATRELWSTDGTPAGTQRLAAGDIATLAVTEGRYFFTRGSPYDFASGVWVTDGTPAGTVRWSTMALEADNGGMAEIGWPYSAVVGDRLIVRPDSSRTADQGLLDVFDSAGHMTALEPGPGVPDQQGSVAGAPVFFGGAVHLPIAEPPAGARLGVTEGSAATTRVAVPTLFRDIARLTGIDGLGWFSFTNSGNRIEVWRSDGTEAGTFQMGETSPSPSGPRPFVAGGDGVLLSSMGLYTSDGSPPSLRLMAPASYQGVPAVDAAGRIYHALRTTSTLTVTTVDPVSGTVTPLATPASNDLDPILRPAAGAMYFTLYSNGGWYLWRSAATPATTAAVLGAERLNSNATAVAADHILFVRTQDGRAVLTTEVGFGGPLAALGSFVSVDEMVSFGDRAVFLADDGEHGVEPWITDGTPAGTRMIAETVPGLRGAAGRGYHGRRAADSGPHLFAGQDRCYFWVADGDLAAHAWTTDGTSEGTHRLGRLPDEVRQLPTSPADFLENAGLVYFRGWTPDRGVDLYAVRLCDADFTGDAFVDFFDYLGFADAFEAGTPDADFNSDGFVDFFDYGSFVDAFERGC